MQKCFFKIVLIVLGACVAGCSQMQSNENTDEKGIREAVKAYQEAYNNQDAEKLSRLWVSDASYFNPLTGKSAEGRDEIEQLFKNMFAQENKKHLEITITNITFPNANEAIQNGIIKAMSPNQPEQQVAYQVKFVKQEGKWLLKTINEIELQAPFSNYERIKELAWLVGKWEDSDEHVQILFDNQWDTYRNFITEHFKMKIYDQDNIEGKQIIAWDPLKEIIRSWVFDSDGGFGEGTWEKVDNSWIASMRYTLSDGRAASAKNVYTVVNDSSYTFASVEREVDGEILPDMDPVTVKRIE